MSLYKPKGTPYWYYDITFSNGERRRGSTFTANKKEAKSIEARERTSELSKTSGSDRKRITIDEALATFYQTYACELKSAKTQLGYMKVLLNGFSDREHTYLDQIDDAAINEFVNAQKKRDGISDTTINRYLQCLRAVITRADQIWGRETGLKQNFTGHMLIEPDIQDRSISRKDAEKLISCAALHLRPIIAFALLTGLRKGNILELKWEQIDWEEEEITFKIKSNKPGGKEFVLEMAPNVIRLLTAIGKKDFGHVFLYEGHPITTIDRSFRTARKAAGISVTRFHDLRHTAATWMVRGEKVGSGSPLDVVQQILGHASIKTTQRYAHRSKEEKKAALAKLGSIGSIGSI